MRSEAGPLPPARGPYVVLTASDAHRLAAAVRSSPAVPLGVRVLADSVLADPGDALRGHDSLTDALRRADARRTDR